MGKIIRDLFGYKYRVKEGFKILLNPPKFKGNVSSRFTKNIRNNNFVTIYHFNDTNKTLMLEYNVSHNYYVLKELELISYDENKDIRKAYKHGNKYHP